MTNPSDKILSIFYHGEPFFRRKRVYEKWHFVAQALLGQKTFTGNHAVEMLRTLFTV
jgi:hypothetical protein